MQKSENDWSTTRLSTINTSWGLAVEILSEIFTYIHACTYQTITVDNTHRLLSVLDLVRVTAVMQKETTQVWIQL